MTCGTCGHVNQERARFCDQCGTALPSSAQTPGEHKYVTVLFADVRGSMILAESLGAERWRTILERCIRIINDGVHRFGGTINQYTGDGAMALFGAPRALEDHARRACLAAIAARDRLRTFSLELQRTKGIDFAVRLGLHSGEVIVGALGDALREEYTAQGHAVGLAQRIEQLAAPNSVYISQITAALVANQFALRDAGEFRLKGVSDPMRVFEVERARPARSRVDAASVGRRTRFVGRKTEVAVLAQAVEEAMAGRGAVVGIVGEAGVGKTRLCAEVLRLARARNMMLARTHCPAHATEVPLLPVLDLLRSFFRVRDGQPADVIQQRVRRRLRGLHRRLTDEAPTVFDFLGVPDAETAAPVDVEEQRRQRVAFMRRLIQTQSAKRPLFLIIDDAHCMHPDSDGFVAEIVDALGWTRTLLLINYRPGYRADWMSLPYWRELPLTTLSDDDADELLLALVGNDPSTHHVRNAIRINAGGNAFFMEEMVQALLDHGALEAAAPAPTGSATRRRLPLTLKEPRSHLPLPPTVHAVLAARIDRLSTAERAVLQTAAVIGRRFSLDLLAQVLGGSDSGITPFASDDVQRALDTLEAAAFVRRDRTAAADYSFKHPLTQAVAYSAPLADARTRLHVAVARGLEHLHAECLGQHAALIGHHYNAAGWSFEGTRWRSRAALNVTNITLARRKDKKKG